MSPMDETSDTAMRHAVAIIGMTCRFPGADDIRSYWLNLRRGIESISRFSDEELAAAGVPQDRRDSPHFVAAGAVLRDIDQFDADFFGIPPREAEHLDPQQRLFLECASSLLESAGYAPDGYPGLIGVFAGASMSSYLFNNVLAAGGQRDVMQIKLGNDKDFLPSHTAYELDLRGPCVNVQSACSTSLAAIHLGCQSLLTGEADMVLAGGVAISIPQQTGYVFEPGILSPDGHCRAFDADARGVVSGNGVGIVLLKLLPDALADGDHVYAVIRGSALNNDGSDKLGFTAPGVAGQAAVIAEALAAAGVSADSISYVEAHGTGTELGDVIEVQALTRAFRASTERRQFCGLGSVKTNIGHLDAAAGVAGLIKVALALEHEALPPSLNYSTPNPKIDFAASPFYVNARLRPWPKGAAPRRAGVSAFGIGGTNVHLVVEEAPEPAATTPSRPWQVLALSAKTDGALRAAIDNLIVHLQEEPDTPLADVAHTLLVGRRAFPRRSVLICRDRADALEGLTAMQAGRRDDEEAGVPASSRASVSFLLPGLADDPRAYGAELERSEPSFRAAFEQACAHLDGLEHGAAAEPLLFARQHALARTLLGWGIAPDSLLGSGVGELVAACIAGVMSLADACRLVVARTRHPRHEARMTAVVDPIQLNAPRIPILSSSTGDWLTDAQAMSPSFWAELPRESLAFDQAVMRLSHAPTPVLLEIGPAGLASRAKAAAANHGADDDGKAVAFRSLCALSSLGTGQSEQEVLLEALGALWCHAVPVDWALFYADERRRRVPLPTYPFERQRYWISPTPAAEGGGGRPAHELTKRPDVADWFYLPAWQPSLRGPGGALVSCQRWLLLADEHGVAAALTDRLVGFGVQVVTVLPGERYERQPDGTYRCDLGSKRAWVSLLQDLADAGGVPDRICHLPSLSTTEPDEQSSRHDHQMQVGFECLLALVQALAAQRVFDPVELWIVTNCSQWVESTDVVEPVKATMHGLCKVVSQEFPNIGCRIIDVAMPSDPAASDDFIGRIVSELDAPGVERTIALRGRDRKVQSFLSVPVRPGTAGLRKGGTYLITGGLGLIGSDLAQYLMRELGANVALVSRTPPSEPSRDEVSPRSRRLRALHETGGALLVVAADVGDEAEMRAAITTIEQRFGVIHGVIHAAGVTAPESFPSIPATRAEHCRMHWRAKVDGVRVLDRVLDGKRLDFCMLTSSLSSVLGGLGYAAYGAANAYLDLFAWRQSRSRGLPWISVNLAGWPGEAQPMAQQSTPSGIGAGLAALESTREEAIETFVRAVGLTPDTPQVAISTADLHARLRQWVDITPQRKPEPAAAPEVTKSLHPRPALSTVYEAPTGSIETVLAEMWRELLGIDPIGAQDDFMDLGGDSLLMIGLVVRIRNRYRIEFSLETLLVAGTIAQMALIIEGKLLDEIEAER
jgi:acyl transferase domain-containing protein/acyl carrier protein